MTYAQQGQSLFELVVAIGVTGLILLSLVSLATLSVRNASSSRNQTEAARLGVEAVEWLRKERDDNWGIFFAQSTSSPSRCVKGLSWAEAVPGPCSSSSLDRVAGTNLFYRQIDFTSSDSPDPDTLHDTVEAVIKVYWTDSQGYHEVRNSTFFTDWRNR